MSDEIELLDGYTSIITIFDFSDSRSLKFRLRSIGLCFSVSLPETQTNMDEFVERVSVERQMGPWTYYYRLGFGYRAGNVSRWISFHCALAEDAVFLAMMY